MAVLVAGAFLGATFARLEFDDHSAASSAIRPRRQSKP